MNIKELQAIRKQQKKLQAKHDREIDVYKSKVECAEKKRQEEYERHQKQCYDVMELLRGRYHSTNVFSYRDTIGPSHATFENREINYALPRVRRWDYNVDMNMLDSIDSKIILEEFLNTICQDIRHQWAER